MALTFLSQGFLNTDKLGKMNKHGNYFIYLPDDPELEDEDVRDDP